jgi:hypothetical protein
MNHGYYDFILDINQWSLGVSPAEATVFGTESEDHQCIIRYMKNYDSALHQQTRPGIVLTQEDNNFSNHQSHDQTWSLC